MWSIWVSTRARSRDWRGPVPWKGSVRGVDVRVYNIARTVADCFRFRNTVGLDVALEALSEAWRCKRLKMEELNRIAKKLRVQRVMQPYLETVVL